MMLMDAYVATYYLPEGNRSSNIYACMWLGNPAMPVWSGGVPEAVVVSYPSHIFLGTQDFHVSVRVRSESPSEPMENARVCAYKPGDFYAVGLTDDTGGVTLTLNARDTGSFFVWQAKDMSY